MRARSYFFGVIPATFALAAVVATAVAFLPRRANDGSGYIPLADDFFRAGVFGVAVPFVGLCLRLFLCLGLAPAAVQLGALWAGVVALEILRFGMIYLLALPQPGSEAPLGRWHLSTLEVALFAAAYALVDAVVLLVRLCPLGTNYLQSELLDLAMEALERMARDSRRRSTLDNCVQARRHLRQRHSGPSSDTLVIAFDDDDRPALPPLRAPTYTPLYGSTSDTLISPTNHVYPVLAVDESHHAIEKTVLHTSPVVAPREHGLLGLLALSTDGIGRGHRHSTGSWHLGPHLDAAYALVGVPLSRLLAGWVVAWTVLALLGHTAVALVYASDFLAVDLAVVRWVQHSAFTERLMYSAVVCVMVVRGGSLYAWRHVSRTTYRRTSAVFLAAAALGWLGVMAALVV